MASKRPIKRLLSINAKQQLLVRPDCKIELETAQALMFPEAFRQHVSQFNASVLIRAKEGRRNGVDC
jgi:hypothetical protein